MSQSLVEPSLLKPPGQSRFVLLERPIANPGICKVCGAVDRPVVDFGSTDDDGAIYFCTNCLTEVAKTILNLVDASDLKAAQLTASQLQSQLNKAGSLTDEYINAIHGLHSDFISSLHSVSDADGSISENISSESDAEGHGEIRGPEPIESSGDESISVGGPTSVPATSRYGAGVFNLD